MEEGMTNHFKYSGPMKLYLTCCFIFFRHQFINNKTHKQNSDKSRAKYFEKENIDTVQTAGLFTICFMDCIFI